MTDKLPPNLLALFAPRPALRYFPPSDHAPEARKTAHIGGLAQYLDAFKDPVEYHPTESWLQRRDRKKAEKREKQQELLTDGSSAFDPSKDSQIRGDAYKTLFIARLSFEARESDLEREFGRFGPIERIRIVTDNRDQGKKKSKKSHKGYAFVVFEREKDMKAAYKETDGIRIRDRRVLVDVERGRTVKGWKPRRFGGGLGGRGYTKASSARPSGMGGYSSAPAGPRGGFRGGFGGGRGGFRGESGGYGRGGYGQGRGGIGYQGGSSNGGGGFGGRGGYGGQSNGGQPPINAPSGPGGSGSGSGRYSGYGNEGSTNGSSYGANGSGGYADSRGGGGRSYEDRGSYRGGRSSGDRSGDGRGSGSGSNREPVRPRESGGYRDRESDHGGRHRDRDEDSGSRKRYHDSDSYDDHRSKRRY